MMASVKAPRSVFVDFPLGHQCGRPMDKELQNSILRDTLSVLESATEAGLIAELPYTWECPFTWEDYMADIQEMLAQEGGIKQEWKPTS